MSIILMGQENRQKLLFFFLEGDGAQDRSYEGLN